MRRHSAAFDITSSLLCCRIIIESFLAVQCCVIHAPLDAFALPQLPVPNKIRLKAYEKFVRS